MIAGGVTVQLSSGPWLWASLDGLNLTPKLKALPPFVASKPLQGGDPTPLHQLIPLLPWLLVASEVTRDMDRADVLWWKGSWMLSEEV